VRDIHADPAVVDSLGAHLDEVSADLAVAAGGADLGGGITGSTALTGRALEICSLEWSQGLGRLSDTTNALATFARGTALAFRTAGG
jgi:hypothetical protein